MYGMHESLSVNLFVAITTTTTIATISSITATTLYR
jgi:hypothetical protein